MFRLSSTPIIYAQTDVLQIMKIQYHTTQPCMCLPPDFIKQILGFQIIYYISKRVSEDRIKDVNPSKYPGSKTEPVLYNVRVFMSCIDFIIDRCHIKLIRKICLSCRTRIGIY